LLDIKPYIPQFDHHASDRIGWLANNREKIKGKRSDERFG
jgi:tRNA (Thr-GGU) A37 N-methylase